VLGKKRRGYARGFVQTLCNALVRREMHRRL
jgi:hypothetical protein